MRITTREISEVTGRSVYSVRRDIRIGKLDRDDALSVSLYIVTWAILDRKGRYFEEVSSEFEREEGA